MDEPTFPEPISVEEGLSANVPRLDVPERTELSIGIYGNAFAQAFRVVEVVRFDELQTLGLVPHGITEQQASEAIEADERDYHKALVRVGNAGNHGCSCEGSANGARSHGDRREVISPRRGQFQWNLVKMLESPLRRSVEPGDLAVINAYAHLRRWYRRSAGFLVGLTAASDIYVMAGATLTWLPTVSVVHANSINIWPGGRLEIQGGSVFVRCEKLNAARKGSSPPPPPGGGGGGAFPPDPPPPRPPGGWQRIYLPGIAQEAAQAALQQAQKDDFL
ncbi:hypothetical protein [Streptomyces lavendofoliae]|uniref:hypothetical protein n=1 Tax=Streptomyces lavendofoliae TaxID=67314 RepID=UPI003D922394